MRQPLAEVYTRNGRNMRIYTTPGRSVQFHGGHATVVDHRDMPHVLQTEGFLVQPTPEAMSWADDWLSRTREIKAEVTWPEGWSVDFRSETDFETHGPTTDVYVRGDPVRTGTEEPVDMTARPWINPADLLSDPEPEPEAPGRKRK